MHEWLIAGAEVAVLTVGGTGPDRVELAVVERLTKTQAVMADGARFSLRRLDEIGVERGTWSSHRELAHKNDDRVKRIAAVQRQRQSVDGVRSALERGIGASRKGDWQEAEAEILVALLRVRTIRAAQT